MTVDLGQPRYSSLDTLVQRVRRLLNAGDMFVDFFSAAPGISDATVNVNNATAWAVGDVMEAKDTTGEQMKILNSWGGTANPINVYRGWNDTVQAPHANNLIVFKNPTYPFQEIKDAVEMTLFDMWPQAWQAKQFSISPNTSSAQLVYPVPAQNADILDIISAVQDNTPLNQPQNFMLWVYNAKGSRSPTVLRFNVPTTVSATGIGIEIPYFVRTDNPVIITYRTYIDTSVIEQGLMADTVAFGACARILGTRQVTRSGLDLRQAEPGTPEVYLQDAGYFEQQYQIRLRKLHLKLLEDPRTRPMRKWG